MLLRKRHKTPPEEFDWRPAPDVDPAVAPDEEDATPPDWREPDAAPSPEEQPAEEETSGDTTPPAATDEPQPPRRKRGIRIGQFFTGSVLTQEEFTRRLPVIVYIVLLMLLYIANGFHVQHKHSELDRLTDELKQLKTEAVTSSAVRMTITRQSEVERLLEERNMPLKQGGSPTHLIEE